VKKVLVYKRFVFTEAQQNTLIALLAAEHKIAAHGAARNHALARDYKGLHASIKRQSLKQIKNEVTKNATS